VVGNPLEQMLNECWGQHIATDHSGMAHHHHTSPRNSLSEWQKILNWVTYHIGRIPENFIPSVTPRTPEGELDQNVGWNSLQLWQTVKAECSRAE